MQTVATEAIQLFQQSLRLAAVAVVLVDIQPQQQLEILGPLVDLVAAVDVDIAGVQAGQEDQEQLAKAMQVEMDLLLVQTLKSTPVVAVAQERLV